MTPFDLEKAKAGAELMTISGRPARIICYDRLTNHKLGNIIALVKGKSGVFENIVYYNDDGCQMDHIHELDLVCK